MADITATTKVILAAEDQTAPAFNSAEGGMKRLASTANSTQGALNQMPAALTAIMQQLRVIAAFEGLRRLAEAFYDMADANKLLQARLMQTVGTVTGGRQAFAGLVEDATRLRVPIEEAARGFVRLGTSVQELGGSVKQARALNEVLLTTAKVSGVAAGEAVAAARQFTQALGSGVLQGDELRSVLENNQELARQLAAGLGISIGELRRMGAEGKLTADVVANALLSRLPDIRAKLKDIPITVGDAFTLLKNEIFLFVGALDQAGDSSGTFAKGLTGISNGLHLIRAEFADGNIIKGLNAMGLLMQGRFGKIGEQLEQRPKAINFRQIEEEIMTESNAPTIGAALATKKAYEDLLKVADDFETKQERVTRKFGEQMQAIAKVIEKAQVEIAQLPAGSREREVAETRLADALVKRGQAEVYVVKALKEANEADAKKGAVKGNELGEYERQLLAQEALLQKQIENKDRMRKFALASEIKDIKFLEATRVISATEAFEKIEDAQIAALQDELANNAQKLANAQKVYDAIAAMPGRNKAEENASAGNLIAKEKEIQAIMLARVGLEQQLGEATRDRERNSAIAYQKETDAINKINDSYEKFIAKLNQETETRKQQIEEIGLTADAQVRLTAERQKELELIAQYYVMYDQLNRAIAANNQREIEQIQANIRALGDAHVGYVKLAGDQAVLFKQATDNFNNWKIVVADVQGMLTNFFNDALNGGSNAFKNLWENFKKWAFQAIAQVMARKIVVSLIGDSSGLVAPGSGAAGLLGGNGGVGLGDILKLAKNFFGSDSLSSFFTGGGFGSTLGETLGLTSVVTELGGVGAYALVAEEGLVALGAEAGAYALAVEAGTVALTSFGAAALAVIPVVGWIAAAALIAWQIWGNKGGGPKSGGFASTGDVSGISGTDNSGRYFTPNQADPELIKTLESANTGYLQIAKALNLKIQNVGFALGFDTDPLGTASNQIHSGTFVNGQQVYNYASTSGELGRDDKVLQERLALETKRIVFAALQASLGDAPRYLQQLFEGVDAATVTSEQIDAILATAQALQIVVAAVHGLGDQFAAMDADQIAALAQAFGGLQAFMESATFLNTNFTTDAQKTAVIASQLQAAFDGLNVALPTSHQGFLDLLASFDLTTEEGRQLYASVSRLAPAFIAVNGTAQDAATAAANLAKEEEKLTAERRKAIDAAVDFFNANFYTAQEQAATKLQANWNIVHNAWTEMGEQLLALGYSAIPTTNAGFRQLIETLRAAGLDDLADSLVLIAPAIFGINEAVAQLTPAAAEAEQAVNGLAQSMTRIEEAANAAATLFQQVSAAIEEIVSQSGGDFGDKSALRLKLLQEQITRYEALIAQEQAINPYGPLIAVYQNAVAQLKALNVKTANELARFTILSAQFGAQKAEQLVALESWYATQRAALGGQVEALAALQIVFDAKWKAIIEGTQSGVDDTLSELQRIQKSLREWLDNILLGDLSPLTPQQKLNEAQRQYEDLLKKAQGGDLEALAKLSSAADEYLKQAREFYASSPDYTAIFASVIAAIKALAGTPPGVTPPPPIISPGPTPPPLVLPPVFVAAIPSRGKMVSDEDLKEQMDKLAARFVEGLNALAVSNAEDSEAERETIRAAPKPEMLK